LLALVLPLLLAVGPCQAIDGVAVQSRVGIATATAKATPAPALASPLEPLFKQALEASRAGRFDLALPLWSRVLELAPDDAAAWSNRGNVRLGLGRWSAAAEDYHWILERDPEEASALYNLGNVEGSRGDWHAARDRFEAAVSARPGFAMARSSAALAAFELGDLAAAERELRNLIRRYPLFADARAALTALLWQRGAWGEAESNWAAASGLDSRYRQTDWLLQIRRWPPGPVAALRKFLDLRG
jgi:tetratricopeptide (TPR) repeat protein